MWWPASPRIVIASRADVLLPSETSTRSGFATCAGLAISGIIPALSERAAQNFTVRISASEADARTAIAHRDIYGALVLDSPTDVNVQSFCLPRTEFTRISLLSRLPQTGLMWIVPFLCRQDILALRYLLSFRNGRHQLT